jgi:hypothetical protein
VSCPWIRRENKGPFSRPTSDWCAFSERAQRKTSLTPKELAEREGFYFRAFCNPLMNLHLCIIARVLAGFKDIRNFGHSFRSFSNSPEFQAKRYHRYQSEGTPVLLVHHSEQVATIRRNGVFIANHSDLPKNEGLQKRPWLEHAATRGVQRQAETDTCLDKVAQKNLLGLRPLDLRIEFMR